MLLVSAFMFLLIGRSQATLHLVSLFHNPSTLSWEGGALSFSSNAVKNLCTQTETYIPENMIATKVGVMFDTIIRITPRFKKGNPATISTYDLKSKMKEPEFTPFPALEDHEEGNCDAIQNAVDFYIDHNAIMWILDSGVVEDMSCPRRLCPPKIVGISLSSKKIVYNIDLSPLIKNCSKLSYIVVDYDCKKSPFVYVSDSAFGAILIYDVRNSRGFRVTLPKSISGSYKKHDTLFIAITKLTSTKSTLYLSYFNSPNIFSIDTNYLKRGEAQGKLRHAYTKPAPAVYLGTDGSSSLYFRYKNEATVYEWKTSEKSQSDEFTAIHTSEDDFTPISVTYDQLKKEIRVLEANFDDYSKGSCGIGAIQQLSTIHQ